MLFGVDAPDDADTPDAPPSMPTNAREATSTPIIGPTLLLGVVLRRRYPTWRSARCPGRCCPIGVIAASSSLLFIYFCVVCLRRQTRLDDSNRKKIRPQKKRSRGGQSKAVALVTRGHLDTLGSKRLLRCLLSFGAVLPPMRRSSMSVPKQSEIDRAKATVWSGGKRRRAGTAQKSQFKFRRLLFACDPKFRRVATRFVVGGPTMDGRFFASLAAHLTIFCS